MRDSGNNNVFPAFGGETIRPLCPLPIGATKSIILGEISSELPEPVSNLNLLSGKSGVKFSKAIFSCVFEGSLSFIDSTWTKAKYLSCSLGGLILPITKSPILKLNFLFDLDT